MMFHLLRIHIFQHLMSLISFIETKLEWRNVVCVYTELNESNLEQVPSSKLKCS